MFKIKIDQLKVMANIGTSLKERRKKQPLLITVSFEYKFSKIKNPDNINNLISYSELKKYISDFIYQSKYQTLEKLILECKKILKKEFKIKKIFILIEKPNIAKKYNCRSVSVSQ